MWLFLSLGSFFLFLPSSGTFGTEGLPLALEPLGFNMGFDAGIRMERDVLNSFYF